jgi:hypothetical protein
MNLCRNRTLIILDWDDTLFPTTWVTTNDINIKNINNINNINNSKNSISSYFQQVDIELENLLRLLLKCGHVAIITNAMLNWINVSSNILPRTSKILENGEDDFDIEIISARGSYQSVSKDPMDWKKLAFEEILKNNKFRKINNIISIGDAEYEYKALINLYENTKSSKNYKLLKSVKFVKYPTNHVLLDQIKVMQDASIKVCTTKTHLDLRFELQQH